MIDWLTLKMDASLLSLETRRIFTEKQDRIVRISPDGERIWEIPARTSIRSDSHQIIARMGSELEISGSPARVMYPDNVFGSSDVIECFKAMIHHINKTLEIILPVELTQWKVTRMDYAQNYKLESLVEVKQALNYLRHTEGGRYQIRTAAESVYWSQASRLRSGKAYAKGPHLEYLINKGKLEIDPIKLKLANQLLRLEIKLGSQFWRERTKKPWYQYSIDDLKSIHTEYFKQFIGDIEIVNRDSDILEALLKITTEGQAKAAYRTWCLIKSQGMQSARELTSRPTWYRHKKLFNRVGVTWADFQEGKIIPFRRKTILLDERVESWDYLLRLN